jgi:hypothetical protein
MFFADAGSRGEGRGDEGQAGAVTSAMFEFAEKRPQLLRLVFATNFAAPEEIPAECVDKEKRRRNFDFVKGIVEEGVKAKGIDESFSAAELAHGLYGAITHYTRLHLLCGEGKLNARVAARLVDLYLHGAASNARSSELGSSANPQVGRPAPHR